MSDDRSKTHKSISKQQWDDAADRYELGLVHARQIARELGVSPSTVSREFKRRGCVKACRVEESIAPLIAELDEKDRARRRLLDAEFDAAAARTAATLRLMDEMMKAVVSADRSGNLTNAIRSIEQAKDFLAARP